VALMCSALGPWSMVERAVEPGCRKPLSMELGLFAG
jgi:hypothetical protein